MKSPRVAKSPRRLPQRVLVVAGVCSTVLIGRDIAVHAVPRNKAKPKYFAEFGPSGGYGWLVVRDTAGKKVFESMASNSTTGRDLRTRYKISERPAPPNWPTTVSYLPDLSRKHMSRDTRTAIQSGIPDRPGIFFHSTRHGNKDWGWWLTQGCIRLPPNKIEELKKRFPTTSPPGLLSLKVTDGCPAGYKCWPNGQWAKERIPYPPLVYHLKPGEKRVPSNPFEGQPNYLALTGAAIGGRMRSPDGQYLAELPDEKFLARHGYGYLKVFKAKNGVVTNPDRQLVFKKPLYGAMADGFAWLPAEANPHSFIIAARMPAGRAFIAVWQPEKAGTWKFLAPANATEANLAKPMPAAQDPDSQLYLLTALDKRNYSLAFQKLESDGLVTNDGTGTGRTRAFDLQGSDAGDRIMKTIQRVQVPFAK